MSTLMIDFHRGFDRDKQRGGGLRLGRFVTVNSSRHLARPNLGVDLILLNVSLECHWLPGQMINFNRRAHI